MLARIKNANRALHETVELPSSRLKAEIARLLKEEGYIRDYRIVSSEDFNQGEENKKKHRAYDTLVIDLKFGRNRERASPTSSASPSPAAASTPARTASRASSAGWARRSCPRPTA